MGSHPIQLLTQLQTPTPHNRRRKFAGENCISSKTPRHRCFSRWGWDKDINPNRRSRFRDSYDKEVEYGSAKRRRWWSDDEDDDEAFGILDTSIGFDWILKVFRAFGWVIPVAAVSLFVGTGPNAVIMAVALPLAQSALSLAADALWGTSYQPTNSNKTRPSSARKKKKKKKREQETTGFQYKSWDANDGKRSRQNFGGWDELDKEPVDQEVRVVKVSRRAKGETPLLIRFLIAMFPHFGFWTNFF